MKRKKGKERGNIVLPFLPFPAFIMLPKTLYSDKYNLTLLDFLVAQDSILV
jgi:hypothetical protein